MEALATTPSEPWPTGSRTCGFLKSVGISRLLEKHEEPTYHEKKVVAHTDDELSVVYGAAKCARSNCLSLGVQSSLEVPK
jgi:hypothetical protein